jgi:hypothetical protein
VNYGDSAPMLATRCARVRARQLVHCHRNAVTVMPDAMVEKRGAPHAPDPNAVLDGSLRRKFEEWYPGPNCNQNAAKTPRPPWSLDTPRILVPPIGYGSSPSRCGPVRLDAAPAGQEISQDPRRSPHICQTACKTDPLMGQFCTPIHTHIISIALRRYLPALGTLRAMCYGSLVGGSMTELILTGTIGGLLGTGLALIGVRQVRIIDSSSHSACCFWG